VGKQNKSVHVKALMLLSDNVYTMN